MKTKPSSFFGLGLLILAFAGLASAVAQSPAPNAADATAATAADPLEQIVAPIALYPDVLIALILPASTESSDVVLAARYLERGGSSAQLDSQPWDQSVKGLAHYPDVVKWMDENLSWTRQLGDAYLESSENVMAAIQRVRARAKASGLLVSTAEQQVVDENGYIRIQPAQPNVVYVPRYDPEIIYIERPVVYHTQPWITFGAAFGVGWWLNYDCDWRSRVIVVNPHYRNHWRHHHDWRHHRFAHRGDHHHHWKRWTPSHRHPAHRRHFRHHGRDFARPTPHPGAPRHHWNQRPGFERRHGVEPRQGHGNRHRERLGDQRLHRDNRREHFRQPSQPPSHLRGGGPRGFAVEPNQPRVAPRQRDGNWERRRDRDGHARPGEHRQRLTPPAGASPRPQVAVAPPVRRSAPERHPAMRGNGGERRFSGGPRPQAPQVAASRPHVAPAPRMHQPARSDMAVRQAPRMAPSGGGDSGHRGGGQPRSHRGGHGRQNPER